MERGISPRPIALTVVFHIVLTRTRWGLHTIAAGGNLLGARGRLLTVPGEEADLVARVDPVGVGDERVEDAHSLVLSRGVTRIVATSASRFRAT